MQKQLNLSAGQVRAAAERGLQSSGAQAPSLIVSPLSPAPAKEQAPMLAAMLAMVRNQHPALAQPPTGSEATLPDKSFLALLRFLQGLPDGDDECEDDKVSATSCGDGAHGAFL